MTLPIPRQGGLGPQIAQQLYRNVPFGAYGDHEPNICIEIGSPANRRRAEGSLYVLEIAFTVQKALCTFEGKGHPVQKVTPVPQERPNLGPNWLKFKMLKNPPKRGPSPPGAGYGPCAPKLGPNIRKESE